MILFRLYIIWTFNPDINNQAQEITISHGLQKSNHAYLTFNGTSATQSEIQKHLGMFLDSKLNFKKHIQSVINKAGKKIGLLRKLQKLLPRPLLIIILKSFIRPYLDDGDIIYNQTYNVSFYQKLESIQYNAALTITGSIRSTSRALSWIRFWISWKQNNYYLIKILRHSHLGIHLRLF